MNEDDDSFIPTEMAHLAFGVRVSEDDYWDNYAEHFIEWIDGEVINLRPFTLIDLEPMWYLHDVLAFYLEQSRLGRTFRAPFLMMVDARSSRSYRVPDIQVLFKDNFYLTEYGTLGPADICIEFVTRKSVERDYDTKFIEYQTIGVPEYWLFDPEQQTARFYRLNRAGVYEISAPDADGCYRTSILPAFKLEIAVLWRTPLPTISETLESVKAMLVK
jgi:Uma2 family endonuclease